MNLEASLDFSVPIINPTGIIRKGAAGIQQKSELQNFHYILPFKECPNSKSYCITKTFFPKNFEVGFVGAFFCFFFGQAKKKKEKNSTTSNHFNSL